MKCPVCGKNGCNNSVHHYWWPKKKYTHTAQRKVKQYLHPTFYALQVLFKPLG